jgi:pantoate--beta-alanine ligase
VKGPIPCGASIAEVRTAVAVARSRDDSVALVPTMGALHEGHLSLVRRARNENGYVVVSVFVNPTQFGVPSDLETYPRDLARDRDLAQAAGADLIFRPTVEDMYPGGFCTWVDVEGLTAGLCGASRPGHYRGVCTVVTKLFNICAPDRAYFGEKDFQQLAVIRRMTRDLDLPVEVIGCPTVRESDGLAMSSRNARLSATERDRAPVLYRALVDARTSVEAGERDATQVRNVVLARIAEEPLATIDYVEIVGADDLKPVETMSGRCVVAVAVWLGGTRLIDNLVIEA